jgi:hypothetical protein
MNRLYAGVGSRETPLPIIREMENIGMRMALLGWTLRSGKAKPPLIGRKPDTDSADLAFERGCNMVGGKAVIRVATLWQPALDHAATFHPNWSACSEHARALHARNSQIMLGDSDTDFNDPVAVVVCWTEGGAVKGGTGQALRIAAAKNIPVFNLAVTPADAFWSFVGDRS